MSRRSRYRHTVPPPWRDEESQLLVGSSVPDHNDIGARLLGFVGSFDESLPELLNYPRQSCGRRAIIVTTPDGRADEKEYFQETSPTIRSISPTYHGCA